MQIAFIGLGNMGGPMALNLLKAGHEIQAFDLSKPACDKLAADGVAIAASATAAAGGCMARNAICAMKAPPTASPMVAGRGRPRCSTATATSALAILPITADQGCASGLFGTAKIRKALAPSGATRRPLSGALPLSPAASAAVWR